MLQVRNVKMIWVSADLRRVQALAPKQMVLLVQSLATERNEDAPTNSSDILDKQRSVLENKCQLELFFV